MDNSINLVGEKVNRKMKVIFLFCVLTIFGLIFSVAETFGQDGSKTCIECGYDACSGRMTLTDNGCDEYCVCDCPYDCVKDLCGAECDGNEDCGDTCNGDLRLYGGSCTDECVCTYSSENCAEKNSYETDSGCSDYFTKGYVYDYTTCENAQCKYNIYTDSCGEGNVLTEYCADGASYTYTTKDCDDYDNYYCNGDDIYFKDYGCSEGKCTLLSDNLLKKCGLGTGYYCRGYDQRQKYTMKCENGFCVCCRDEGNWEVCKDGWYGGGDTPGCGDDPSSYYRDYYCTGPSAPTEGIHNCSYQVYVDCNYFWSSNPNANCDNYNLGESFDCDSQDICSNTCNGD
ncbi:MAG: hypothetical protein QW051_03670, partial [Candidatus Aenigmatarchaeota archaeon]